MRGSYSVDHTCGLTCARTGLQLRIGSSTCSACFLFWWSNSPVAFEDEKSQSLQSYCFPLCLLSTCFFNFSLVPTSKSHWSHFNLCKFHWCTIKSWRFSVLYPQMAQRCFEKVCLSISYLFPAWNVHLKLNSWWLVFLWFVRTAWNVHLKLSFQNLGGGSLKFTRAAFYIRFYFMLWFNVHSKICEKMVNIITLRTHMLCRCALLLLFTQTCILFCGPPSSLGICLRALYDVSHGHGYEKISSLKFLKGLTIAVLSSLGISLRATYDISNGHEQISCLLYTSDAADE